MRSRISGRSLGSSKVSILRSLFVNSAKTFHIKISVSLFVFIQKNANHSKIKALKIRVNLLT